MGSKHHHHLTLPLSNPSHCALDMTSTTSPVLLPGMVLVVVVWLLWVCMGGGCGGVSVGVEKKDGEQACLWAWRALGVFTWLSLTNEHFESKPNPS